MFRALLDRLETLWHKIERLSEIDRAVIAVTSSSNLQSQLRILAIRERWHILFARTPEDAALMCGRNKAAVVLYDRELDSSEWRTSLCRLVRSPNPVLFILLSRSLERHLCKMVLDYGGYDVARMPLQSETLGPLVNGAFNMLKAINSALVRSDGVPA